MPKKIDFIPRGKKKKHIAHSCSTHLYTYLKINLCYATFTGFIYWIKVGGKEATSFSRFKCNVIVQGYTFKGLVEKWSPIL